MLEALAHHVEGQRRGAQVTDDISLITRRTIRASQAILFAAWTQPEQLRAWFGPRPIMCVEAQIDLREGGAYRIVNRLPDGSPLVIEGVFETVDPPSKLVYSWSMTGDPASRVTVRFEPRGDATEVIVEHEHIADQPMRDLHDAGWVGSLDRLAELFPKV
jgi:uncharacterized protein YndB with AHSA1/START domain